MILKQLNKRYQEYMKYGKKIKLDPIEIGHIINDSYMFYVSQDLLTTKKIESTRDFRFPMCNLYHYCRDSNFIFGTNITISFSIFLITLNGDFFGKFDRFLNDIIFSHLKPYQQRTPIGGVGCFDLLYSGALDDLKYFIVFDKEWDRIVVEIYSNLILNFFKDEVEYNNFYIKIRNFICTEGVFLEKNEKESRISFYKQFYGKAWVNNFFLSIFYFNKIGYHPSDWWQPLHMYYAGYMKTIYNLDHEITHEYCNIVCNNKFFTRWGILFNKRPVLLSAYKDESLEEVCAIYTGLGISNRFMMNNSFLNGVCKDSLINDMVMLKQNHEMFLKGPFTRSIYDCYNDHNNGQKTVADWEYEKSFSVNNDFVFYNLVFNNNYGDITGSIYTDYEKERSISFLSSIRSPHTLTPKSLNFCVRSLVPVVSTDLYDEIQIFIPEYYNSYMKKGENWLEKHGLDVLYTSLIDQEMESSKKKIL